MKYVIVLGDGMADEPIPELGGLTPLEYAKTPALDAMAPVSEIGLACTIPEDDGVAAMAMAFPSGFSFRP